MDFAIRKEARKWFEDIRHEGLDLDFDAFYFCFIAGITAARKKNVPAANTAGLVDYFPDKYKNRGKLLIALFLSRELDLLGIKMNERKSVHDAIANFVKPDAPNHLSDEGVREFNRYAHGGYDVLLDWFDDRPRSLETFLRMFRRKVNEVGFSMGVSA